MNDFTVQIYNIQKPSPETVLHDYTHDYFIKLVTQRRVNAKKTARQEKTLAALIKSVKEQKGDDQENKKSPEEVMQSMKDNIQQPMRTFELPYQITCIAYQGGEEER